MSHKLNGSSWRSDSIKRCYFDEDTYDDKKIAPKRVQLLNDPKDGDYDELCKNLSGDVIVYKMEQ